MVIGPTNRSTISIRRAGIPDSLYTIEMSMDAFKAAMDVYVSYKFAGILSDSSAVNAAQLCTAGINQHLG